MSPRQSEQNIFFLYELAHIDACTRFLDENPQVQEEGYLIIPSGLQIEYALAEKGIPFRSCRAYRPRDISRFGLAEEWTVAMFDSPEWKWFQYRGIALTQIFSLNIQDYILRLLYYGTILENIIVQHPAVRRLLVFPASHSLAVSPSVTAPMRGQPLLREQIIAVVECAELIGKQRGVEVVVTRAPLPHTKVRIDRLTPIIKRAALETGLTLYNIAITLLRPRGTPRILASDYWRNVSPILSKLSRGELMLFDRAEIAKVGMRNLWHHRIRLYNFSSFSIRSRAGARREAEQLFHQRWSDIRDGGRLPECRSGGSSLRPLLVDAFEGLLKTVVPHTLRDIDGAYAMLEKLRPDIVFLRASVSLQTHFSILAMVARALGIPSLEIQHGLENLGPGSYSKRHSAEYVAVYGKAIQDEFVVLGYPREHIPVVGSPRFDAYKKEASEAHPNRSERKGFSVLCVGTLVAVESAQDEYDLEDYYVAIAQALEKIPDSSIVIKLRPGSTHEQFYRATIERIFARVPYTIAQYESFPELFASNDAVVTYFSTSVLEALPFNMPTVIYSGEPREEAMTRYHFTQYKDAGGVMTAYNQEELEEALSTLARDRALRTRLSERAGTVLAQFQLFDGRASERIIE